MMKIPTPFLTTPSRYRNMYSNCVLKKIQGSYKPRYIREFTNYIYIISFYELWYSNYFSLWFLFYKVYSSVSLLYQSFNLDTTSLHLLFLSLSHFHFLFRIEITFPFFLPRAHILEWFFKFIVLGIRDCNELHSHMFVI